MRRHLLGQIRPGRVTRPHGYPRSVDLRTSAAEATSPRRRVSLGLVLAVVAANMLLGFALHSRCAEVVDWTTSRWGQPGCYSDISNLWRTNGLAQGRFPYLQAGNEYPVGTGIAMGVAALPASSPFSFLAWNAAMLAIAAAAVAWALFRMVGARALWFALSPSLLLVGLTNWDLLAVALATLATLALFRDRPGTSGALLGLGAATKLYPALFVVPFALERWRRGDRRGGVRLVAWAAAAWLAVNLPVAFARPSRWSVFFRYNRSRVPDVDSLWALACRAGGSGACPSVAVVNLGAGVMLAGGVALAWWARRRRDPGFARWTLVLPVVAIFLLTTKVYSPQYSLWLVPLLILALPDLPLFVMFCVADVAVTVSRFAWFADDHGQTGMPYGVFAASVLIRAAVLVWLVVAWVRGRGADRIPTLGGWRAAPEARGLRAGQDSNLRPAD